MLIVNSSFLKKVKVKLFNKYKLRSRTIAFKNRYKNIDQRLFINRLNKEVVYKYKAKWEVFNVDVETDTFILCYNLSGKIDYNIVPENIFAAIIEPRLNKNKELSFFSVKNIYEKWFNKGSIFPKSYFHKIDGIYYDNEFNIIQDIYSFIKDQYFSYPMICKPSMGTSGGVGVRTIISFEELKKSLNSYENLVYQEKIIQNGLIEIINPGMSSIRTCLYRDKSGKFKVLNSSIRFGVNGSLDNETAGGIVCNINKDGKLNDYAVTKYCEKHIEHPNSKIVFSEIFIPFYKELAEVAESIANEIPLCNLVSLDMCLDSNNEWRCIEINITGQTIRFAQYAGKSFFGKYTDEMINKVKNTV
ncbi:sugar-transfer associated ATP-grasp domain-containing protein [Psychrobacter sp. GP33]|uniref:sugar-transfer associated ATP-grasp domain-containing protein n=1 Tax=Psychrobacter sp. GP33 TaxID=2758709 RepID=UPI0015FE57D5|nr:sugar-transfer associated ATP-grasp domain-containing protein [Psychrobacter sp. GP33]